MRARLILIISMALMVCTPSVRAGETDLQGWNAIAIAGPVQKGSRVLAWFDGHARFKDDISDIGTTIIRPALGWRVRPGFDIWLGYARVTGHFDNAKDIQEDRIWQQATYTIGDAWGGNFSGRSRLEQRFRETGDDVGWRVRQFVRFAKRFDGTDYSFVAWDEVFIGINDTDWGVRSGFDQNRLFGGLAWHIKPKLRFEGGYMHNYIRRVGQDRVNHNISFTLFWNL